MRSWRETAALELIVQRVPRQGLASPVAVDFEVFPPHDHRARDLDNVLKATLDLLVLHNVLEDDRHVSELHLVRCAPAGAGRLSLTIRPGR